MEKGFKKKVNKSIFLSVASIFTALFWTSQNLLFVREQEILMNSLPDGLSGLRILHISDLHANSQDKINVNIWEKIAELDFDIAVITGDIVDKNAYQLTPHQLYLSGLCERVPVFFVEGNHDHYSMKKLTPMLENAGVKILSNEKKTLEYKSVSFDIIGIEDIYTTEIEKAVSVFEDNENFQLVLVHQPQFVDRIMDKLENSKSLVLSGHTHGGQIRIPFMKTLYAPNQGFLPKYGDGLYELANSKLFISRGIGGTGKMPLRIFNRPEICLLTLKKDN